MYIYYMYVCIYICNIYIYINASNYLKKSRCRASLKAAKWQVFLKTILNPIPVREILVLDGQIHYQHVDPNLKSHFQRVISEFFGTLSSQLFWGQCFFPLDLGWLGKVSQPWGLRRKRRSRSWRSWTWGKRGASATPNSWPAPGSTAGGGWQRKRSSFWEVFSPWFFLGGYAQCPSVYLIVCLFFLGNPNLRGDHSIAMTSTTADG